MRNSTMQPTYPINSELSQVPSAAADRLPADALVNVEAPLLNTVVGFRISQIGFVLPVNLHCEVLEPIPINPIPKVEPWFSGLLNIRGNIAPVVDLRVLLGEPVGIPKKRFLLAIDKGEKTLVLWIDDYPQLLTGTIQPLPVLPLIPEPVQAYVVNAYEHQGRIWFKIQLEGLFKALGSAQRARLKQ